MFKCLIFVHRLTVPEDGEIRTRILSRLEQNHTISLQIDAEKWERTENLRHDKAWIKERDMSKINAIKQKQHKEKIARKIIPCYRCEQNDYFKECRFRK